MAENQLQQQKEALERMKGELARLNVAFDEAKKAGAAGIPCFVLEDGTVTLTPEEAGLHSRPINEGATCNLDGSGC